MLTLWEWANCGVVVPYSQYEVFIRHTVPLNKISITIHTSYIRGPREHPFDTSLATGRGQKSYPLGMG